MLSIHDYRNGRYQGQFKNNLPHGIGIFMHISLTFVIAQWSRGHLDGKAIMIFADGSTYCGFFSQSSPKGLSFYELSMDQIQILQISGSNQEYKGAILLPLQNKIIELGSRNYEIKKQHKIIDNSQPLQLQDVAQIIGLSQNQKRFYRNFPNCYSFFENYFCQTYPDIFEEIIITINGLKQYWIGFKEQGLGIRLQAVHQTLTMAEKKIKNSIELSKVQHRCLEGKVYMIREMGMMSKDNNLTEYGLKTTNQLLKGYTIQEGIFQLPHTITRYQSTTQRPKVCSQTFANHLKRSFHYRNTYLDVSFLQEISKNKGTIEEDIVGTKKQVLAHSLIQRPNKRKKKEDSQTQNLEAVSQDSKDKQVSSFKRGESFLSGNKNWSSQLQEVKKEIYNSIQLKKSNKKLPNVDYTNIRKLQNDQQPKVKKSPEKQILSSTKELNKFNQRSSARNENYHPKNDSLTKDKSKSRDYIQLRKNGSITPRKKYDYIRQQKALNTQKLTKSPPRVQPRTSPGYILKTEKSKGNIKTSPIKQRVAYRDNTQILVPQLKKHLVSAAEKTTEGRFVAVTEKKKFDDYLLRENQGRSYLSHNKKKRLLNELDNFQL